MSTTDKLAAERAAFEAWAESQDADLSQYLSAGQDYEASETQAAWIAWQARAALEAEAKPEPAEPVAWGMRDKTTGLILDVICPDEHESHEGDYTIPLYAAPAAPDYEAPERRCGGPGCDGKCCQPVDEAPAAPAPVPAGFVLLPQKLTPTMATALAENLGPGYVDEDCLPRAWAALLAAAPAAPATQETIKLGAYGTAFDQPGDRRAYTYTHQPANAVAWALGGAAARVKAGGDPIDRGLDLLQKLEAAGFGVFQLAASKGGEA